MRAGIAYICVCVCVCVCACVCVYVYVCVCVCVHTRWKRATAPRRENGTGAMDIMRIIPRLNVEKGISGILRAPRAHTSSFHSNDEIYLLVMYILVSIAHRSRGLTRMNRFRRTVC